MQFGFAAGIQLQRGTERVQALPYTSVLCCHSNETHALIANPPNSAQLQGTPYHSPKLHPLLCSSVGMRRGTDRQTHRRPWPIYISPWLRLTWSGATTTTTTSGQSRHTDVDTRPHRCRRDSSVLFARLCQCAANI